VALELVGGGPDGDRPEGVPNVPPFLVKTALRMVASSVSIYIYIYTYIHIYIHIVSIYLSICLPLCI